MIDDPDYNERDEYSYECTSMSPLIFILVAIPIFVLIVIIFINLFI